MFLRNRGWFLTIAVFPSGLSSRTSFIFTLIIRQFILKGDRYRFQMIFTKRDECHFVVSAGLFYHISHSPIAPYPPTGAQRRCPWASKEVITNSNLEYCWKLPLRIRNVRSKVGIFKIWFFYFTSWLWFRLLMYQATANPTPISVFLPLGISKAPKNDWHSEGALASTCKN